MPQLFSPDKNSRKALACARQLAILCAGMLVMMAASPSGAQSNQQTPVQVPQTQRSSQGPSPGKISIASNQQLFATMCALWASGFNADINPTAMPPAWSAIAVQMTKLRGPAAEEVRKYLNDHSGSDRAALLSRFVSFALSIGPPPDFRYIYNHDDLPPDVLPIEDFNDVLARFYKEAELGEVWKQVAPDYQPVIDQVQGPVTKIVLRTTGYLREILTSTNPRTFAVYVEPLAGASMNFRNYGNRYEVVLGNAETAPQNEIRHAFLHYLLDPLPAKYSSSITPFRTLFVIAARAPRLPREYRTDVVGLFAECLIKAVELQMDRISAAQRAQAIDAAEADGFVLVRPLVAQLEKFQESEPAMTYYFPDLAKGIDVAAERQRLEKVQFAPADVAPVPDPAASEAAEKERLLQQGERMMAGQDAPGAQAMFDKILARWPGTPRAVYGLAISAVMQGQPEHAKELFVELTKPGRSEQIPDARVLSWSHVYLGRINDLEQNRDQAIAEYRAALAVEGAPEAARAAAQRGVEKAYAPSGRSGDHPGGTGKP